MKLLDRAVAATEDLMAHIARYMVGRDLAGYCDLATAIGLTDDDIKRNPDLRDPYTLVNDSNSLLTLFDIQGTYEILSEQDFSTIINNLRSKQNGYMKRHGHSLSFSFERDPDRSHDELMRLVAPQLNAAKRMGLKSEDIILDRVARMTPLVAWEQNLMVVYTHLSVMSEPEQKQAIKDKVADSRKFNMPNIHYGQNPATVLMAMKFRHDSMIDRLKDDFEKSGPDGRAGIMLQPISAHDAIRRIRIMVNRERTSHLFRAVLPGDRFIPRGREVEQDASDLVPPPVSFQICSQDVYPRGELVETDELLHGTLTMELGPQEPKPFAELFQAIDSKMPWRIRIDLAPDGLNEMRGRQAMTAFVGMLPGNQQIRDSFRDLTERSKTDAILSMKFSASSWGRDERETKQRLASLEKAIQSWGACHVQSTHGDPIKAWASTVPAFTTVNVANRMVPPLDDALYMLPLQRPATPWPKGGSDIQRTPDGKIYPIELGSSLQDTWIELLAGTPGSGKSARLNTLNMATVHSGNNYLPYLTIADVAPSSIGLIQMLQDSLPPERKNEAVYLRLKNDRAFAVNPCDTQLGARYPMQIEKDFLVALLTLFCTTPATGKAPSGCEDVCLELVRIAYEDRCGKGKLLYETGVETLVDHALAETGLLNHNDANWWLDATWWEVTDMLFGAGRIREAALAQRQAVPVLPDFNAHLNNAAIVQLFGTAKTDSGEPLLDYMRRCFTLASSRYELFAGRTCFELGSETRVVSVDLEEVIGDLSPEGRLKTTIMYLFVRQLSAKNYFLAEKTLLPLLPPQYHDYHSARISQVKDEKKTMAYDEVHNAKGLEAFEGLLDKDGREGRKRGLRIVLSSQYLSDYSEVILNAATSIFVLRGGSSANEEVLRKTFKVSEEAIRRLNRECTGPGPAGANYLALFKTKVGYVVQLLTNTAGPVELWAFSTTREDVALRERLYEAIGTYAARKLLAKNFPSGSAMKTIELMKSKSGADDQINVIEQLARKLLAKYQISNLPTPELL
ncbi:conjugal transfer protein TraU [Xenophilus sp. AP218F]|nr:conjugal transfer protein TraU [Xenophilus sp. AP218F]